MRAAFLHSGATEEHNEAIFNKQQIIFCINKTMNVYCEYKCMLSVSGLTFSNVYHIIFIYHILKQYTSIIQASGISTSEFLELYWSLSMRYFWYNLSCTLITSECSRDKIFQWIIRFGKWENLKLEMDLPDVLVVWT